MTDTTNSGTEPTEPEGDEPDDVETGAPPQPKKRPGAHTDPFHSTN